MAVTEYGTIGIRPMGTYDLDTKYGLLNLVEYDGSSYVAHTDPPVGTLPTNITYWQVSAQGTGKATANSVGTVKPDGTTTEVGADGSISVKKATQEALGLVKGSNGIKVGADGNIDVNTLFTQATELANIIAGEAIATALGKISKSIAVTMGLNENAVLKAMLTNIDANDQNKIPTSAYVHKLTERIGMGEELATGANLTAACNALNSNLGNGRYSTDIMIPQPTSAVLYWNSNTINTPYKHGMTGYAEGMALVTGNYDGYQTVLAIPKGSTAMYIHTTNRGVPSGWQIYDIDRLGKKITLTDIGVFHITRQNVIEFPSYYAVAITITPTATPVTDTPMLVFPSQLATCVLPITTGYAGGLTYASNNSQMYYRLLTGTINNTTEIIINGIIPRA